MQSRKVGAATQETKTDKFRRQVERYISSYTNLDSTPLSASNTPLTPHSSISNSAPNSSTVSNWTIYNSTMYPFRPNLQNLTILPTLRTKKVSVSIPNVMPQPFVPATTSPDFTKKTDDDFYQKYFISQPIQVSEKLKYQAYIVPMHAIKNPYETEEEEISLITAQTYSEAQELKRTIIKTLSGKKCQKWKPINTTNLDSEIKIYKTNTNECFILIKKHLLHHYAINSHKAKHAYLINQNFITAQLTEKLATALSPSSHNITNNSSDQQTDNTKINTKIGEPQDPLVVETHQAESSTSPTLNLKRPAQNVGEFKTGKFKTEIKLKSKTTRVKKRRLQASNSIDIRQLPNIVPKNNLANVQPLQTSEKPILINPILDEFHPELVKDDSKDDSVSSPKTFTPIKAHSELFLPPLKRIIKLSGMMVMKVDKKIAVIPNAEDVHKNIEVITSTEMDNFKNGKLKTGVIKLERTKSKQVKLNYQDTDYINQRKLLSFGSSTPLKSELFKINNVIENAFIAYETGDPTALTQFFSAFKLYQEFVSKNNESVDIAQKNLILLAEYIEYIINMMINEKRKMIAETIDDNREQNSTIHISKLSSDKNISKYELESLKECYKKNTLSRDAKKNKPNSEPIHKMLAEDFDKTSNPTTEQLAYSESYFPGFFGTPTRIKSQPKKSISEDNGELKSLNPFDLHNRINARIMVETMTAKNIQQYYENVIELLQRPWDANLPSIISQSIFNTTSTDENQSLSKKRRTTKTQNSSASLKKGKHQ